MSAPQVTAIILTRDEAAHIAACIESVRWCDSVLVFDSGSTDGTPTIAEASGARVLHHEWQNYSTQREAALRAVATDWVFFVDADERSSAAQAAEIRALLPHTDCAAYDVPRHNYIFGKLTRGAGWYPDYQRRLMQPARARYDLTREVHELVIAEGPVGALKTPLLHYNYRDARQFHAKQSRYTDYAVRELRRQGVRAKARNYVLQPLRQFYWRLVTLGGWRDGLHGLRLSAYMAYWEWVKYRRLG